MTVACKLCGELIESKLVMTPDEAAAFVQAGREPLITPDMHARACMVMVAEHVMRFHSQHAFVMEQTVTAYRTHLLAKLAVSSDPEFEELREQSRRVAYWTLRADVAFEQPDGTPAGSTSSAIITP